MSELEPPRAGPPGPPKPSRQDQPWPAWWSWVVRFMGLAIMAQQAFFKEEDRQWLLLCAMGMMLGEIGLKALVRFFQNMGGDR